MPYGDRNVVLDALDLVLEAYQEAKVKVAKDVLLLRYVWLDVDKVRCYGDTHLYSYILSASLTITTNK